MHSQELLQYLTSVIDKNSMCYTATIPDEPRRFLQVVGDEVKTTYEKGILLERRDFRFKAICSKRFFIYEPLLWTQARKQARHDAVFANRLNKGELTADDIESLIQTVTGGIIKLHMKGRTIFEDDD